MGIRCILVGQDSAPKTIGQEQATTSYPISDKADNHTQGSTTQLCPQQVMGQHGLFKSVSETQIKTRHNPSVLSLSDLLQQVGNEGMFYQYWVVKNGGYYKGIYGKLKEVSKGI